MSQSWNHQIFSASIPKTNLTRRTIIVTGRVYRPETKQRWIGTMVVPNPRAIKVKYVE